MRRVVTPPPPDWVQIRVRVNHQHLDECHDFECWVDRARNINTLPDQVTDAMLQEPGFAYANDIVAVFIIITPDTGSRVREWADVVHGGLYFGRRRLAPNGEEKRGGAVPPGRPPRYMTRNNSNQL